MLLPDLLASLLVLVAIYDGLGDREPPQLLQQLRLRAVEAVAWLIEHLQMRERRACSVLPADRQMIRYLSRRPPEVKLRE